MTRLPDKIRTPEIAVAGSLIFMAVLLAVSEDLRTAGLGLFRHVADSYLIMFIDTMSMSFICF